jgi:hypothetical protein
VPDPLTDLVAEARNTNKLLGEIKVELSKIATEQTKTTTACSNVATAPRGE